jgi:hypothetical protein
MATSSGRYGITEKNGDNPHFLVPIFFVTMEVMGLLKNLTTATRRWYHQREIDSSLSHYRDRTGLDAEKRQMYSESGSFRSQLDRLFTLGNATETGELRDIASYVVTICLSNKYYRPADYLSDFINALENRTFLGTEPNGEPPIQELDEHLRKLKLDQVMKAFLVPLKVASIENLVVVHAKAFRRLLPYAALGRFERQAAKLYSLIEEAETRLVEQEVTKFMQRWSESPELKNRFKEPAEGLAEVVQCLEGGLSLDGTEGLRVRRGDQPLRMSTVVPEDRQYLLKAALGKLS